MLMFDRITSITADGGEDAKGQVVRVSTSILTFGSSNAFSKAIR